MRISHLEEIKNKSLFLLKIKCMRKSILLLLAGATFGIMSFKIHESFQNKPAKIYRKGNSKIVVWDNKGADEKMWKSYQVEKEYTKDDETKYTNKFNEKELLDLKVALDEAIAELETK
jgi:hypothetical protein